MKAGIEVLSLRRDTLVAVFALHAVVDEDLDALRAGAAF
jgi:hypothetical protein